MTSKILPPPWPWTSNFKRTPLFPNDNQSIKKSIIQGWLLYVIRPFLQVGFRFQYQLVNLVWLPFNIFSFRGDTHMTPTLREDDGGAGRGLRQKWDVIGRGGVGLASVLDAQSYFFRKLGCAMTRHHAESNNILLTRNLPIDSGIRQWSHPLMIPLHCLWAKSNNRTRGEFEWDVTWFCFYFEFVRSHARCGCCSIVC